MQQAMDAMRAVEKACSRFDMDSELSRLLRVPVGTETAVSPILFQTLQFACEVAKQTEGRFDPTIGARMEELGFRQHYLTGDIVNLDTNVSSKATFRDIELSAERQSVTLHQKMKLDLGAVAKGLAVDLATKELENFDFGGYVVDAGGDLFAAGTEIDGEPWSVDIRHPAKPSAAIQSLSVQNLAVCTSGTYERRSPADDEKHHILDAHTKDNASGFLSITAVGPFAMLADAFSTAAFLYSPDQALALLTEVGLAGMVVLDNLSVQATSEMEGYFR